VEEALAAQHDVVTHREIAPRPVDHGDVDPLAGGQREAVDDRAERVAERQPRLLELEQLALGDREVAGRELDRARVECLDRRGARVGRRARRGSRWQRAHDLRKPIRVLGLVGRDWHLASAAVQDQRVAPGKRRWRDLPVVGIWSLHGRQARLGSCRHLRGVHREHEVRRTLGRAVRRLDPRLVVVAVDLDGDLFELFLGGPAEVEGDEAGAVRG
jgi:hypothetical protein